MSLKGKVSSGGEFVCAPPGQHVAVIVQIIELGLQPNLAAGFVDKKTGKKAPDFKETIRVRFEFPEETLEDGRPHISDKDYNLSFNPKAGILDLYRVALGLNEIEDGAIIDLHKILGKGVSVEVISYVSKKGSKGTSIKKVSALGKRDREALPKETHNKQFLYDIDEDGFKGHFNDLSEFLQGKVRVGIANRNGGADVLDSSEEEHFSSDVPF